MEPLLMSQILIEPKLPADSVDDGGITNVRRAEVVHDVLGMFHKAMFGLDEEVDTVLGDFLADLLHFCRLTGVDFEMALSRGRGHFAEECRLE